MSPEKLEEQRVLLKHYLEHIADKLGVKDLHDWYRVSHAQFVEAGGFYRTIQMFKGLGNMLQAAYPDHRWELAHFSTKLKKSTQREVLVLMNRIFPHVEVVEEPQELELLHESMRRIKFDLWLPSLQLAIEFEGPQHYAQPEVASRSKRKAIETTVCIILEQTASQLIQNFSLKIGVYKFI